jgi:hypothetical protein
VPRNRQEIPKAKLRIPSISGVFYFGTPRSELALIPTGRSRGLRGLDALVAEKFADERETNRVLLDTIKDVA